MVHWFGAVQAQEYAQTKWGLGLRLSNVDDDQIESDFTTGKILRTHLLRPTWHFVSAKDIRWLLALTAPRVHQANAYMYRQQELDNKVFNKCHDILGNILQGGKELTREEINEEFASQKIVATGHRLSYIMMQAELEGIICSGARKGNQFTYALLDERVKEKKTLAGEEALYELTKRYFSSRGPATVKDFSTWSGLTIGNCKKGVDMIGSKLKKATVEKQDYYFASPAASCEKPIEGLHLLPIYDEFIMGYKDREAYFQLKNSTKVVKIMYDNMIIVDGQIIGTWKRAVKATSITVAFQFFKPLNKNQQKLIDAALHRLQEFTNMKVHSLA